MLSAGMSFDIARQLSAQHSTRVRLLEEGGEFHLAPEFAALSVAYFEVRNSLRRATFQHPWTSLLQAVF
jgi:hypothetical protein